MKTTLMTVALAAFTVAGVLQAEPYWQQPGAGYQQMGQLQMDQIPVDNGSGHKGRKGHKGHFAGYQQQQQFPQQQQQQDQQGQFQQTGNEYQGGSQASAYPAVPPPRPDYAY